MSYDRAVRLTTPSPGGVSRGCLATEPSDLQRLHLGKTIGETRQEIKPLLLPLLRSSMQLVCASERFARGRPAVAPSQNSPKKRHVEGRPSVAPPHISTTPLVVFRRRRPSARMLPRISSAIRCPTWRVRSAAAMAGSSACSSSGAVRRGYIAFPALGR